MRIFVAGATGALGIPIIRTLVANGHTVFGLTRSEARAQIVTDLGARPVIGDALDTASLVAAASAAAPEAVVHALTAIPKRGPLWSFDLNRTNELRVIGTRNLLSAATAAGARRIVVESMAFVYGYGDLGRTPLAEDRNPSLPPPKKWLLPSLEALAEEERQILEANRSGKIEGIVLRFGLFYGPGAGTEIMVRMLKRRLLPLIVGGHSNASPWIHIEDAAACAVAALYGGRPGDATTSPTIVLLALLTSFSTSRVLSQPRALYAFP